MGEIDSLNENEQNSYFIREGTIKSEILRATFLNRLKENESNTENILKNIMRLKDEEEGFFWIKILLTKILDKILLYLFLWI